MGILGQTGVGGHGVSQVRVGILEQAGEDAVLEEASEDGHTGAGR